VTLPVAIIDSLAFGGNGVCRIDGKVCFVPFSCPGDEVSLRITSQKKSYSTASISEIIHPSPSRTVPVCALFGECGGCSWQHISYPAQIEHKRKILAETLWRGARVPADLIDDVVAASSRYGYRNRLQFKVSARNGKLRIGFYRQESHQVVDAAGGCPVAAPVINQALECFRAVLQSYPDVESISQLSIDAGESGVVVVIHHTGAVTAKNAGYFIDRSGDFGPCTGLFLKTDNQPHCKKLWGSPEISYRMNPAEPDQKPVQLTYPPGGFAQVISCKTFPCCLSSGGLGLLLLLNSSLTCIAATAISRFPWPPKLLRWSELRVIPIQFGLRRVTGNSTGLQMLSFFVMMSRQAFAVLSIRGEHLTSFCLIRRVQEPETPFRELSVCGRIKSSMFRVIPTHLRGIADCLPGAATALSHPFLSICFHRPTILKVLLCSADHRKALS